MGKYNIGEIWWTEFPFSDCSETKRRPAIVIDDENIAILTLYVTSQDKDNPYSILIDDWKEAGLSKMSWARIDKIVSMEGWRIQEKIGNLTEKDLLKFLQLVTEFNENISHEFSLAAISRTDGKFLQIYDDRWDCYLFPYVRSSDNNLENVENFVSNMLHIKMEINYVSHTKHCKYSVSDQVYKIYHHKLYKAKIEESPESIISDEFDLDGRKYKWFSFSEMETNSNIMDKNEEVVAFVKSKCC